MTRIEHLRVMIGEGERLVEGFKAASLAWSHDAQSGDVSPVALDKLGIQAAVVSEALRTLSERCQGAAEHVLDHEGDAAEAG